MRIAILHEDKQIFVSYTDEEFIEEFSELIGIDREIVEQAINKMVSTLKRKTLTA